MKRDGISLVPTLVGRGIQAEREYLYWEFHESGISQAVLLHDRWKGLRLKQPTAPIQLYDLTVDLGEQTDVAARHPELTARIDAITRTAHVDTETWRIPALTPALDTIR